MAAQSSQFVGSIPENYDEGLGPHIFMGYADDLARRVAALRPDSVLELAAGTGIVSRKLRDVLPGGVELLTTDLSPPMLEVAKAKFQPGERVTFEQADATELRFGDASFDVVACQFGVMFFPDKARSYTEVCRVLKPGGSYVFNVWDAQESNPFAQIAHNVVETFFSEDPPGFYKIPFGYHDADEIRTSVLHAGFDQVTIERLPLKSKVLSAGRFAKGLVFGNPLNEEIVERGGDPQAVCAALADVIERQIGSEMSLQALIVHASRS